MPKEKTYTINQIIERMALSDEEILLCKQHREYNEKLDEMFKDHPRYDDRLDWGFDNFFEEPGETK